MFRKLLVVNRGEIAIRVMVACEELGIETVAVYSDADRNAEHVEYADEAYNIGPPPASDSYLDQETIVETAKEADADAIHPGYGFLAENAGFARLVEATDGITWVGPPSTAMEQLGEKTQARSIMQDAGVPVVPGTTTPVEDADEIRDLGDQYGYPIAIKAEGGGGGRGMKIVRSSEEAEDAFTSAQREGEAYFDNDSVYVEKYLDSPKHIEVQILADQHENVRHLGERECSLQRRHQKVIEEAPSPALSEELREEIGSAARRGVSADGYTNAGTVEFLVEDGEYYFMEVNTRIQVEHTVSEEVTGIDIVRWQIRIAAGDEIPFTQDEIEIDGHAIEYRINAENPAEEFVPTPGVLETYNLPSHIGIRMDHAVSQGDEVSGDYDSMFAKLIVSADSRDQCFARSKRALRHFQVEGISTTIPFHQLMLDDEVFVAGDHTTKYLDEEFDSGTLTNVTKDQETSQNGPSSRTTTTQSLTVEVDGKRHDVVIEDGLAEVAPTSRDGNTTDTGETGSNQSTESGSLTAEMQGTILSVNVSEGDEVSEGTVVCVMEAMKMENDIVAPSSGTVSSISVSNGDSVDMGDTLAVIE